MAGHKVPRRVSAGSRAHKIAVKQGHRRSGAKKGMSRRVIHKLFRGRVVNAPKHMW